MNVYGRCNAILTSAAIVGFPSGSSRVRAGCLDTRTDPPSPTLIASRSRPVEFSPWFVSSQSRLLMREACYRIVTFAPVQRAWPKGLPDTRGLEY